MMARERSDATFLGWFGARIEWGRFVVVGLLYYVCGELGTSVAVPPGYATALWLPSGIAVAALSVWGLAMWPAVFAASFLVNLQPVSAGLAEVWSRADLSFVLAFGSTTQAVAAAWAIGRLGDPFARAAVTLRWAGVMMLVCLIAASIGVAGVAMHLGEIGETSPLEMWWTWWLGDVVGILVVVPLVFRWNVDVIRGWFGAAAKQTVVLGLVLLLSCVVAFGDFLQVGYYTYPLAFIPACIVVIIALRMGHLGVAISIVVLGSFATVSTINQWGYFVREIVQESLFLSQLFVGFCALSGHFVASFMEERDRLENEWRKMAAVVESTEDAVLTKDLDGIVRSWNPGAERMYGYSAEEMIGTNIERIIPPSHRAELDRIMSSLRTGERVRIHESERIRKDGTYLSVSVSIAPVRNSAGKMVGASVIARDMTESLKSRKQMEEMNRRLVAKTREMEQFTFTVSHDLKSPIVTAKGFLSVLKSELRLGALSPDALSALQRVERAHDKMAGLIGDLLQVSRLGRVDLVEQDIDMEALIRGVVAVVRDTHGAAARDAHIQIEGRLPAVRGDWRRLEQLFENLVSNAVKHGAIDDRALDISIGFRSEKGWLRFFVSDNGPGISPKYHERIFGMFEKLDGKTEGSGVGLAIVARVASMHGGEVRVDSELGEGSLFWVSLPEWRRVRRPESGAMEVRNEYQVGHVSPG